MADNSRKNQKKSTPLGLFVFILIILINALSEASPQSRAALVPVILVVVVLAVVFLVISSAVKKSVAAGGASPVVRHGSDGHPHSPRENFPSPDAYCLVCDQTNTDHFERDRQRRLRQLDYWLSIGLIDRKEYRTLKDRYNKSVPHSTV